MKIPFTAFCLIELKLLTSMLSFSAEMTKEEENNGEIKVNEAKQTT